MFDNDIWIIFESFPILFNVFIILTQKYQYFSPLVTYIRSLLARCYRLSAILEKKDAVARLDSLDKVENILTTVMLVEFWMLERD